MPLTDAFFVIIVVLSASSVLGAKIFTRHRERMSMIEKGMKPEDAKQAAGEGLHLHPLSSLKYGLLLVGVGVGVLVGLIFQGLYGVPGGVYPALIALFAGIALIIFHIIAAKKKPA